MTIHKPKEANMQSTKGMTPEEFADQEEYCALEVRGWEEWDRMTPIQRKLHVLKWELMVFVKEAR